MGLSSRWLGTEGRRGAGAGGGDVGVPSPDRARGEQAQDPRAHQLRVGDGPRRTLRGR